MDVWGPGAFENDAAMDWVAGLETADDLTIIRETLETAAETTSYLDTGIAAGALAAAEIVAALRGKPAPEIPTEVTAWVAGHRTKVPAALVTLAVNALDAVAGDSELKDRWERSGDGDNWEAAVVDLRDRLVH